MTLARMVGLLVYLAISTSRPLGFLTAVVLVLPRITYLLSIQLTMLLDGRSSIQSSSPSLLYIQIYGLVVEQISTSCLYLIHRSLHLEAVARFLRTHYSVNMRKSSLAPRLGAEFSLAPGFRVRVSGQFLESTGLGTFSRRLPAPPSELNGTGTIREGQ